MPKYKLINTKTKEEHLCDKIVIDGFDYYVSDNEQPKIDGELYHCKHKGKGINVGNGQPPQKLIISTYSSKRNLCSDCKKVIATNNPNIDIPKVVDEVWKISKDYVKTLGLLGSDLDNITSENLVVWGYNKSQETHPFSEEDMIEFAEWIANSKLHGYSKQLYEAMIRHKVSTTKELLQIWKEQQPKTVYYE